MWRNVIQPHAHATPDSGNMRLLSSFGAQPLGWARAAVEAGSRLHRHPTLAGPAAHSRRLARARGTALGGALSLLGWPLLTCPRCVGLCALGGSCTLGLLVCSRSLASGAPGACLPWLVLQQKVLGLVRSSILTCCLGARTGGGPRASPARSGFLLVYLLVLALRGWHVCVAEAHAGRVAPGAGLAPQRLPKLLAREPKRRPLGTALAAPTDHVNGGRGLLGTLGAPYGGGARLPWLCKVRLALAALAHTLVCDHRLSWPRGANRAPKLGLPGQEEARLGLAALA
mmetsp:Transcript_36694/g.92752  ORF Transcript_36694/g.92752 Transcript_36694/m.92752 type:complete len:285 (-) Transcript_36694:534-1388(-)